MVELARQQLERFAEEGVAVSPVDAVRVAEAARRLRDAKADSGGSPFLAAPRVRWCGGVRFHEPTVQVELWLADFAAQYEDDADLWFWLVAFALAHADEPGYFSDGGMNDRREVRRRVEAFRRELSATREAVEEAVVWCIRGEWSDDEPRPENPHPPAGKPDRPAASRRDACYSDLAEAIGATGADAATLSALTLPALDRAIRRAWELGGASFKECPAVRELAEWNWLAEEIRRKSKEKEGRFD